MKRRTFTSGLCLLLAAFLFAVCGRTPAFGEGTILHTSLKLKTPKKASAKRGEGALDEVKISIWIPEGVRVLRGVIVNPFNLKQVERKDYHKAARLWKFAIIGANFFGVKSSDYITLLEAMKEFAERTGHKEIEHFPMILGSFSAGSGMLMEMARLWPDRVICCAPVGLEVGPNSPETRKIPIITVFGEKDMRQMEILTRKLPEERKKGALWAIAVNWGRRHEYANANDLVWPFYDQVIRHRLPSGQRALDGSVKLRAYREEDGWLGDISTWDSNFATTASYEDYRGDRTKAAWFPNEYIARVWQAFVSRSPNVAIRCPDSEPEEKTVLTAGTEISTAVSLSGAAIVKGVEYFDGSKLLATKTDDPSQATIAGLPCGVRALIAAATVGDRKVVSKPVAVVVYPAEEEGVGEGGSAGDFAPLGGKIGIVLDGAVFQDRILDGKPYQGPPVPLYLETAYEDGNWKNVLGNAPSFNRGHHRGRVLESDVSKDRVRMTIEMSINSDPWGPGGRAEYEVDLERRGPQKLDGRFTGMFREKDMHGKATAEAVKLLEPSQDFVSVKAGEHPRLLFRKSDIPLLKEKAKTRIGRAAMKKIEREESDAIALGIKYQFTGDRKCAEAAAPLVRAKMKERGGGRLPPDISGASGSPTLRWLMTYATRRGTRSSSGRFSTISTGSRVA